MKLLFLNLYPQGVVARYTLSSYVLKCYLTKHYNHEDGLTVDVVNFSTGTDIYKICNEIISINPTIIGYSCYTWNIEKILSIIKYLKTKIACNHILGGPEISINRIQTFQNPKIGDYYIVGEGERKLLDLIIFLSLPKDNNNGFLKGIAYWNGGEFFYKKDKNYIKNLDDIPSVFLSKTLEDRLYSRQEVFLETQRGCCFKCKYCVYHKNMPSISYYSLKRICNELEFLIVKKKVAAIRITDSIFTSDIDRAKEIIRFILKLKNLKTVRLPWIYWELSHFNIDKEFIKLTASLKYRKNIRNYKETLPKDIPQNYSEMLRDYTVVNCIGIQSFNKQSLKAVGRYEAEPKSLARFMNLVKKYNIALKVDFIMDLPFETFDSWFAGLETILPYFKDTDHILNVHRLQILPGSELETLSHKYGIQYSKDAPHFVFQTTSFSKEEIIFASKLTAILFRIINSPLKNNFFSLKEKTGKTTLEILKDIFYYINNTEGLKDTYLIKNDNINDIYWNDQIFREIPSQQILTFLKSYNKTKRQLYVS